MLLHVIVQILLRQESLVANVTLKLVLVQVGHLSVLVQRIITRIELPANVAHVLGTAVSSDVEFQVPFHLEAFSTVFAREFIIVCVSPDVMGLEIVLCLCAIIAFIAAVQQTYIDVLMDQSMGFQVAFVFERFVTSRTLEGSMETVLTGDMAKNFALLLESHLTNVARVSAIAKFLVQVFLMRGIVFVVVQFIRTIVRIQR